MKVTIKVEFHSKEGASNGYVTFDLLTQQPEQETAAFQAAWRVYRNTSESSQNSGFSQQL